MRRIFFLFLTIVACTQIYGQPGLVKKAQKSVFTLKTFAPDGTMIASSNGFFIGENGEGISNFTPFHGAAKAIVIDAQGKEMNVESILGANEIYDVVKFKVNAKRTTPLQTASTETTENSTVWLIPYYSDNKKKSTAGKIKKAETFLESYKYYTVTMTAPENTVSCPLLNEKGEVIGMLQQPTRQNDTLCYAVSAEFANELKTNGLSINDATLKKTAIKKALPDELDQAILAMYIANSVLDSSGYANVVEDFINKFPNASDGYVYRAQINADANKFAEAEQDMEHAIKVAEKKDDVHYNYAQLILKKEIYKSSIPYANWNLDKAAEEAETAYKLNALPVYRQLKAQILFTQKKYDEAFNIYKELADNGVRNAEIFFAAARCKEMLKDSTVMLAMMDSAVNTFNKPYLKEAAPYILARAQALLSAKQYRKAVADFNEYENLMPTQVNSNFYYIRGHAEIEGHLYQAALNDLNRAIQLDSKNTLYYAEKASLEIRVNLLDEAIRTAQECINIDPSLSDGYLFLGLAQCLKGNKTEGSENLEKAKELGDMQAQELIEKYAR